MCKKSVILGLVLLLAGAALLGWVFAERRKEKQLQQEQRERFKTDLTKLDEVVGDEIDVRHFGYIAYDDNHQQESEKYKKREETRGLVLSVSGVFTLTGGTILSWWLLLGMARLLIRGSSRLTNFSIGFLGSRTEAEDKRPTQADAKEDENSKRGATQEEHQSRVKKHSKVLTNSGWRNFRRNYANRHESALSQTTISEKSKSSTEERNRKRRKERLGAPLAKNPESDAKVDRTPLATQKLGVLLSDKEYVELEEPSKVETKVLNSKTALPDSRENSQWLQDSFKAQTENLEKQMVEFKQMAQSVRQTTLQQSKPVEDSLRELTEQVSAIREYAGHQQDRVKKLQDGYDWNIIRTFCLRVIRCIDNIESRINRLSEDDIDTTNLEEVRDELVFALESTGVEQFEPEINSDYHGQEKNTEAVKEKEDCDDPNLKGKIAKVIRAGYQYFIDEENVKIVRTAQVKLFGQVR